MSLDCVGSVPYKVTFEGTWTLASHPQAYVGSAHWSPPVVVAHSSDYVMWELGGIATSGVESVAETGSTFTLRNELQALQGQSVGEFETGSAIIFGTGTSSVTLEATAKYNEISVISMIAPSPDWIAGVSSIDMCDHETGLWKPFFGMEVYPVDAGTDNGPTLTAKNSDNNPHSPIELLGQQFGNPDDVNPIAYVSIEAIAECEEPQEYYVTLEGIWTAENHPGAWIPEATFSPMVAAAHNADYNMWYLGGIATDGLEQVAEGGMTDIIADELKEASATTVGSKAFADGPLMMGGEGSFSVKLTVSPGYPYVSMVTMLAPSPDWITGISMEDMCNRSTGIWKETVSIYGYPIDAGTDSGTTFMADDIDTVPREPITLLGEVFGDAANVNPVAEITLSSIGPCSQVADGDLNSDGSVNILDAILGVQLITSNNIPEEVCTIDLTGDGLFNVLDLLFMINIITSP